MPHYTQTYAKWLSRATGKEYRLLSEAEYEYAARAGSETKYPWGENIKLNGKVMANCRDCGSHWDNMETAPVGSFDPNAWGLRDMVGNVWEWTEDCWHASYKGAPADGSARTNGDCTLRVVRGGAWDYIASGLRSAFRGANASDNRDKVLGFRVARTIESDAHMQSGNGVAQAPDAPPPNAVGKIAHAGIERFLGVWVNIDTNTRSVPKLSVSLAGNDVSVHVWGACSPTPCDWGEAKADAYGSAVSSTVSSDTTALRGTFKTSFADRGFSIRVDGEDRLQLETDTHFTDNSGRSNYSTTDVFERGQ